MPICVTVLFLTFTGLLWIGNLLSSGSPSADLAWNQCLARFRMEERRFLCPHCLRLGLPDVICTDCRETRHMGMVSTAWGCVHTQKFLASADSDCDTLPPGMVCVCPHCRGDAEARLSARRVRIVAALSESAFHELRNAVNEPDVLWEGPHLFGIEVAGTVTWVLNTEAMRRVPSEYGGTHALHRVHAVWAGSTLQSALSLGRSTDHFLRIARTAEKKPLTCATYLPEDALLMLRTRFRRVVENVTPEAFLRLPITSSDWLPE